MQIEKKPIKLEFLFLVFAVVFGVLTTILIPPMINPDENTHFYNAYTDSRGQLFVQVEDGPGLASICRRELSILSMILARIIQNKIIPIGTFILTELFRHPKKASRKCLKTILPVQLTPYPIWFLQLAWLWAVFCFLY